MQVAALVTDAEVTCRVTAKYIVRDWYLNPAVSVLSADFFFVGNGLRISGVSISVYLWVVISPNLHLSSVGRSTFTSVLPSLCIHPLVLPYLPPLLHFSPHPH